VPAVLLWIALAAGSPSPDRCVADYIESYLQTYPSRATEAGRHDWDRELEDFSPDARARWLSRNRQTREDIAALLRRSGLSLDERLDLELLARHVDQELFAFETLSRPTLDPLFWTGILGNATVFLLVRDDRPLAERLSNAQSRAAQLPRLVAQAREALAHGDPDRISPELTRLAASQARATAEFYRSGFPSLYPGDAGASAREVARQAAEGIDRFASELDSLAARAHGSPRLGRLYAQAFLLETGITEDPQSIRAQAEKDLAAKKIEAAAYGRSVWKQFFSEEPPSNDDALLRRLFARVAQDRAKSVDEFVADYRKLVADLDSFLREHAIVTLPDPLTLFVDRSPGFFVGQSVGGVYAAGPYSPESKTLWFLPTPPDSASPEARDAFFRDFNHHFNVMITPHEILPGHYLQLKFAARHPRKVRALFADGVYVEGWGTFCERLMLDSGWGAPLDRLAHLKKQLENTARAIVDIRVHTGSMTRDEVIRFVKDEALQDDQFASNMWTRAISSPIQITTYYLGYRQVRGLYDDMRRARGEAFHLREFMDGMMEMGPVPVARYRERFLGSSPPAPRAPSGGDSEKPSPAIVTPAKKG
jgi:uncharacterized protein (DUF885 family)